MMSIKKQRICRLCLQSVETDSTIIDEVTREMLNVLLKLNLDACTDPVICQDCAEITKKAYDFKVTYIDKEICILPTAAGEENTQFEKHVLEDIKAAEDISEYFSICIFCMNQVKNKCCVPLGFLLKESELKFVETLPVLMPRMDLNSIRSSIACELCGENFKVYLKFVRNCLNVEEKINAYIHTGNLDITTNRVQLRDVQEFLFRCQSESFRTFTQVNEVKQETDQILEERGQELQRHDDLTKYEKINIKGEALLTNTPISDVDTFETNDVQSKTSRVLNSEAKSQAIVLETKYKCTVCNYESNQNCSINRHIMLLHGGLKMYKCDFCTYETKRKYHLKSHMLIHKDIPDTEQYRCAICIFQTIRKDCLIKHMLTHRNGSRDVSKVKTYKCSICTYEGKRRDYLRSHMLVHTDKSDMEMFKCANCTHQTNRKYRLVKHMLTHRDVSQVITYKCFNCTFESINKNYLRKHMLIHKDVSQVKMYKCGLCTHETRHKIHLKAHMLIHTDTSQLKKYTCETCSYQTIREKNLKHHMSTQRHMKAVELTKRGN